MIQLFWKLSYLESPLKMCLISDCSSLIYSNTELALQDNPSGASELDSHLSHYPEITGSQDYLRVNGQKGANPTFIHDHSSRAPNWCNIYLALEEEKCL